MKGYGRVLAGMAAVMTVPCLVDRRSIARKMGKIQEK